MLQKHKNFLFKKRQFKLLRVCFLIALAYLLTWIPFVIFFLIKEKVEVGALRILNRDLSERDGGLFEQYLGRSYLLLFKQDSEKNITRYGRILQAVKIITVFDRLRNGV